MDAIFKHKSILIIDDVPLQRDLAEKMLNKLGLTTYSVATGGEAIDIVKDQVIDLIFLDVVLEEGLDSLTTFEEIVRINPVQKILLVTGHVDDPRLNEILELSDTERYLQKPYDMKRLTEALHAVFEES